MTQTEIMALQKGIKHLEAAKCRYAIVTPDGTVIKDGVEIAEPKDRKRAPRKYPYGELTSYFKPLINFQVPPGTVQIIPSGKYPPEDIRSGIASVLTKAWGKESYITNKLDDGIEVLRVL